jgi:hypothetical protein
MTSERIEKGMGRTNDFPPFAVHADGSTLFPKHQQEIEPLRFPSSNQKVYIETDFNNDETPPNVTSQLSPRREPRNDRRHPPPDHPARSASNADVRAYMMALAPHDFRHNAHNPGMTPSVVFVGGRYGIGEEVTVFDGNESLDLPIAAHVGPEVADVTAMIAQEVDHRVRQREINQTRMLSRITSDIVVADEVRDESTPGGGKKRHRWANATLLFLVVGGGLGGLLHGFLKEDKGKPVGGSDKSSQGFVRTENSVAAPPPLCPLSLDALVEELRPWIAPTDKDVVRLMDPESPQSQVPSPGLASRGSNYPGNR